MKKLFGLISILLALNLFGYELFRTNTYNVPADFPDSVNHNGNLFLWNAPTSNSNWTGSYGGVNLTLSGTLGNTNDHLGNARFATFDGSTTYLSSTNAALKLGNGAWSMGVWVYQANWNSPAQGTVIGSATFDSDTEGVQLYISSSSKKISLYTHNSTAGVEVAAVNVSGLSAGWHHFAAVRTSATNNSIYIDGLLLSSSSVTGTIDTTSARYFDIGAATSVTSAANIFAGGIQSPAVQIGVSWTSSQVAKIYARGSKLLASVKTDGNLDINLPLEGKWFSYVPKYFKTDGVTTLSGAESICRYSVNKNSVYYNISSYNLGDPSGITIYFSLPILANTLQIRTPAYAYKGTGVAAYDIARAAIDHSGYGDVSVSTAIPGNFGSGANEIAASLFYDWQ